MAFQYRFPLPFAASGASRVLDLRRAGGAAPFALTLGLASAEGSGDETTALRAKTHHAPPGEVLAVSKLTTAPYRKCEEWVVTPPNPSERYA